MSDRIARILLRPLAPQSARRLSPSQVRTAVTRLDDVIVQDASLRSEHRAYLETLRGGGGPHWETSESTALWVALARSMYRSLRTSWAQYVFQVAVAVESLHENRRTTGAYDTDIGSIMADLGALQNATSRAKVRRRDHLSIKLGQILDSKFASALREVGATEIALLYDADRRLFDELRERGRRFQFHHNNFSLALRDVVAEIHADGLRAAETQNYRAAVTLLGAALEGLLLMRCLRSQVRARKVAAELPRRLRTRATGELRAWSFEILIEVTSRAGWLGAVKSGVGEYSPPALAHWLRDMRNLIHPSREAQTRPWQGVYKEDYDLANALYTVVRRALSPTPRRR